MPEPEPAEAILSRIPPFRRLGVDVHSLAAHEFTLAYFRLAKKYHPDRGNRDSHELMARINAARTAILKAHQLRRR